MQDLGFLGGFEKEFLGKSVYMAVGRKEIDKLWIFDAGKEFPRFHLDWIALNYIQNMSDIMFITVIIKLE